MVVGDPKQQDRKTNEVDSDDNLVGEIGEGWASMASG